MSRPPPTIGGCSTPGRAHARPGVASSAPSLATSIAVSANSPRCRRCRFMLDSHRSVPAGGSQNERGTLEPRDQCRLLKRQKRATARKEGAHGGTRGSPVLLAGLRAGWFLWRRDDRRRWQAAWPLGPEQARGDYLALPGFLGSVERMIGSLEECDRVVVRLQLGDTGRDRERAGLADRPGGDGPLEPSVELVGVRECRLREDDRELVAADPALDVGRADDLADALGGLGEHAVAGEVPDAVVDRLEVVEVEDDEGEVAVVAVRAGDLAGERVVEVAPVVQAGERVEVGELASFPEAARILDCRAGA